MDVLNPAMKRPFHPMLLAALCWSVVALIPATRNGLFRAGNDRHSFASDSEIEADTLFDNGAAPTELEREAKRRFSDDRRVRIDALLRPGVKLTPRENEMAQQKEVAALGLDNDSTALSILLRTQLSALKSGRNEGALSNPNGPGVAPPPKQPGGTSSRADWNRFLALAQRGQKLEPDNTFFDWLLLYGLYATRRDAEARATLKLAARKTGYDDHARDIILNRLAVLRLLYGAPLLPGDQFGAWAIQTFPELGKMRQTARWVMEDAIADRAAKRHTRALDEAFDLAKLSRVMRRESFSLIGSLVGSAMENIAIARIQAPRARGNGRPLGLRLVRSGFPLASLQASPISFYAYARQQNRRDITRYLDREWLEINKWRGLNAVILDQDWTGNSTPQTFALAAAARLRALITRALPSILILGALFTLLARRFRGDSGATVDGFWRGALAGGLLFPLLLLLDAIIASQADKSPEDVEWIYLGADGLLATASAWVSVGVAGVVILVGLHAAIGWQKRRAGRNLSLKTRLQTAFDAPEDGLVRFDFSWIFALVAKGTGWLILLGAFAYLCANFESTGEAVGLDSYALGVFSMSGALLFSLFLHWMAWRRAPQRRRALRLSLHLISRSLLGCFVAASVLYALVALAMLPLAFRYDRNFQKAMERGEVKIARAKLGL